MSLTKTQLGIATGLVAGAVFLLWREQGAAASLRMENETLRETAVRVEQLRAENKLLGEKAETQRAHPSPPAVPVSTEAPRLRSQVESLQRQVVAAEQARASAPSMLQTLAGNPEGWSSLRDQQKRMLQMFQGNLTNYVAITAAQADQLHELQADHNLATFALAIELLRDQKPADEMHLRFATLQTNLLAQVQTRFGPGTARQFADYQREIDSHIASQQFQSKMSGTEAEKAAKAGQMFRLMRTVTLELLANRGLPPDHQVAPIYNPMNFVSPAEAAANLQLLADIYDRLAERSAAFFSAAEIADLRAYGKGVVDGNGRSLAISRAMMLPAQ